MSYTKPQIIIDLAEYNELLSLKDVDKENEILMYREILSSILYEVRELKIHNIKNVYGNLNEKFTIEIEQHLLSEGGSLPFFKFKRK